ncbi:MAG: beta/gamma crystallin domain-containing protein [Methylococcaceae bacterium]
MKQLKLIFRGFKTLLILTLLLGYGSTINAKSKDCWADFFEDGQFKGKHFRLNGPTQKKNLLKINKENWDKRIESILIGPKATVTVFENKNFKLTLKEMANHPVLMKSLGITKQDILEDSEIILHPNSKVHSFGEYNFYHKIRSFKIECHK